ncbi:restriction endonuclease [Mesorhizobium sp. BR1-1-3]|uniref:restriction endonuclease n=1 Tax=Mesorhizobium sp. BR1-1-3 TaxID=2876651 RepID=UPI001CD0AE2D|nr:restriction endonuclease [Mesorhizobium sp. BR1-1-3]MBZ9892305.1 restriction endonuclease [Mesorhizobium sp. BR1-1-3]
MKRLASFNDFSPGLIGDIRRPLEIVAAAGGNLPTAVAGWRVAFFNGAVNKRSSTNVPATLVSTGLFDRKTVTLTSIGEQVRSAPDAVTGARIFCKHLVENHNGDALVTAVLALRSRGEKVSKDSLKRELVAHGIEKLSTATTDHTTALNWMVAAGMFLDSTKNYEPVDTVLTQVVGGTVTELAILDGLTTAQRIFALALRRLAATEPDHTVPSKDITDECLQQYPHLFDEDQLRKKIIVGLEGAGLAQAVTASSPSKGRGGKSGRLEATAKLLSIPLHLIIPDFDSAVPKDLRGKINTPLSSIQKMLFDNTSKNQRGLGLELLALRMIMDLGLSPRAFRLRSNETAQAEVDLTAEGAHLLFSRWNLQCKCITGKVPLSDVAKEVGLAIHSKAHVVAVVTTSDFTKEAVRYAHDISASTHLQFLLVPGKVVRDYLKNGRGSLIDFVAKNAREVMRFKRGQPIAVGE